jgi:hypothetical protein
MPTLTRTRSPNRDLAHGFTDWFANTLATRKPAEGGGPDDTSEQDENAEP